MRATAHDAPHWLYTSGVGVVCHTVYNSAAADRTSWQKLKKFQLPLFCWLAHSDTAVTSFRPPACSAAGCESQAVCAAADRQWLV